MMSCNRAIVGIKFPTIPDFQAGGHPVNKSWLDTDISLYTDKAFRSLAGESGTLLQLPNPFTNM